MSFRTSSVHFTSLSCSPTTCTCCFPSSSTRNLALRFSRSNTLNADFVAVYVQRERSCCSVSFIHSIKGHLPSRCKSQKMWQRFGDPTSCSLASLSLERRLWLHRKETGSVSQVKRLQPPETLEVEKITRQGVDPFRAVLVLPRKVSSHRLKGELSYSR